jgi:hypothetical protein
MDTPNAPARLDIDSIASSISLKSLVSGFQNYRCTVLNVLHYRKRYADIYITPYPGSNLSNSVSIVLYGIAVSFLLYAPLIHKHGLHLGKIYFLLQFGYSISISLLLFHLSAKIFKGRGTIRQTTSAYCTWIGFISPLLLLIDYPLFYFAGPDDFISIEKMNIANVPNWANIWNVVCVTAVMIVGIYIVFNWMASVHRIRKWRLFVSLLIIYFPIYLLHNVFVAPFVSEVLKDVAEIADSIA